MAVNEGAPIDVTIELRKADLVALTADVKAFSPKLATALRKRMREAAKPAVEESRKILREATPAGRAFRSGGRRADLIDAIKVSISATTEKKAGIRITASDGKLPAKAKALLKVYNRVSFRHPVFGDRDVWRDERGRPYFGQVAVNPHLDEIREGLRQAMLDAAKAMQVGQVKI